MLFIKSNLCHMLQYLKCLFIWWDAKCKEGCPSLWKAVARLPRKIRQRTLATNWGKRKNICEGWEHVQEKNLKGKGHRILGTVYRKAYRGHSLDPAFPFTPFALTKNYGSILIALIRQFVIKPTEGKFQQN